MCAIDRIISPSIHIFHSPSFPLLPNDANEIHQLCCELKTQAPIRLFNHSIYSTNNDTSLSFLKFRVMYLVVLMAIMFADGLQGTHLYVLYKGYNFNVANLYATGFVAGMLSSPFTGPLVDKFGRKSAAIAYCILEIIINRLEQYKCINGLIISRVVGGVTANLLSTVFESWLVTEHRRHDFPEESLEIILRDSVIISNLSAIGSGILAHFLADRFGLVGPFEGAVTFTALALLLVCFIWEENYGSNDLDHINIFRIMGDGLKIVLSDSKILRLGIIQGLTEGALQTFVFLWSPTLTHFASKRRFSDAKRSTFGLDSFGKPAYGIIFGSFMACGALGGMMEPYIMKMISTVFGRSQFSKSLLDRFEFPPIVKLTNITNTGRLNTNRSIDEAISDKELDDSTDFPFDYKSQPLMYRSSKRIELLATMCYFASFLLLLTPVCINEENQHAFNLLLISFLSYEYLVGVYLLCEGVLRTTYMPNNSICTIMTGLRVIVNSCVTIGVLSTNYISLKASFTLCACALLLSTILQSSFISKHEWKNIKNSIKYRISNNFFHKKHPSPVDILFSEDQLKAVRK